MENLITIRTLTELEGLKSYIKDQDYVAYDVETDGTEKASRIIGLSICADISTAYYVVLSYWDVEKQSLVDLETLQGIKDVIRLLVGKSLIMHNAIFDCWMTRNNFGIELMPSVHTDTMILAHLLDENRSCGLKELATALYGDDARKEQQEMKASVTKNGGVLTKEKYELYKADSELMARYGAKDTILTLKLFYTLVPDLFEQELDKFFYEDECMPLLRGPTYDLNTTGLRIDTDRLNKLKGTLEVEIEEAKAFIYQEIIPLVKHKYKCTAPSNMFNIGASQQLSWLLFFELGNDFHTLTKGGKELCHALDLALPYSLKAKRAFIDTVTARKGEVYEEAKYNPKTKKMGKPKTIGDPWKYTACGKESIGRIAHKYKWAEKLLEYAKNLKLLNTYVLGIQERMQYGIIHPSFLQHGTKSGRLASRNPNFQNLPRADKRIKSCIVARPGKVLIGADYSQLEPRVFASFSKDERLLRCFDTGEDFYSVVGVEVFERHGCSLKKDDSDSFAKLFPEERQISKAVSLSATYGTTAPKLSPLINKSMDEAQDIIDRYFEQFPSVQKMMLKAHEEVKDTGVVKNIFGRPRRLPLGLKIREVYGNTKHAKLPYEIRGILNQAVNSPIQGTGASLINRAAIAVHAFAQELAKEDSRWESVKIISQIHDELILEGDETLADDIALLLKHCMEKTNSLPGVSLLAEPKIAKYMDELK